MIILRDLVGGLRKLVGSLVSSISNNSSTECHSFHNDEAVELITCQLLFHLDSALELLSEDLSNSSLDRKSECFT